MLRTAKLLHPASDPAFRPTPGASLPGTLASPRTGLAPAGRRELLARLRHGCSFALRAPRAAGRTGFVVGFSPGQQKGHSLGVALTCTFFGGGGSGPSRTLRVTDPTNWLVRTSCICTA